MQIIIASGNKGKLKEFSEIFADFKEFEFKSIDEIYDGDFDPEETGSDFIENARIKARAGAEIIKAKNLDAFCLADDSGIEIEALNGEPGIYSGRFLRSEGLDGCLKKIQAIPEPKNRKANFRCTICLTDKDGKIIHEVDAKWWGLVTEQARGYKGFGFDPIVIPEEECGIEIINSDPETQKTALSKFKTVGELEPEYKNKISHRAKAAHQLKQLLSIR